MGIQLGSTVGSVAKVYLQFRGQCEALSSVKLPADTLCLAETLCLIMPF